MNQPVAATLPDPRAIRVTATPRGSSQLRPYLALTLLIAILAALMLYPLLLEVAKAFIDKDHFSLIWIKSALANDLFREQLFTSLALAARSRSGSGLSMTLATTST